MIVVFRAKPQSYFSKLNILVYTGYYIVMKAELKRFRVTKFRSIKDSGWIDTDDTTCFVGTNESGKTNILLALWKLNPANNEPIVPMFDYPRKEFVDYDSVGKVTPFIQAEFEFGDTVASRIAEASGWHKVLVKNVSVSRRYNGKYSFKFPSSPLSQIGSFYVGNILSDAKQTYKSSDVFPKEKDETNKAIIEELSRIEESLSTKDNLDKKGLLAVQEELEGYLADNYKKKTNINGFFNQKVFPDFKKLLNAFSDEGIAVNEDCQDIILKSLPTFVYYSDYGNLDSEIYLPHVIQNFDRDDLGEKERAKTRSLRVLFEYVRLSPQQILELGKEEGFQKIITINHHNKQVVKEETVEPTEEEIAKESEQKREREIRLTSASSLLTEKFAKWWKQGNYIFRFQADGNHFKIWVSDSIRTEEIELEGRSRGLQWFFSFFLVFLVESKDSHSNCILLLDEPGLSLHPVAQQDLMRFFQNLSKDNQLLYTTHSPFLVETSGLSSVKAMYVGDDGASIVSTNLRSNERIAEKSIYPIHAAIGITVSETLLLGCQPVLVEGVSDQIYLQLIKKFVLREGKYRNDKEIVFIPTGGVKGMSPVIKIILGRENDLPYVLLDSDSTGETKAKNLKGNLYKDENEKVLGVSDFLSEGSWEIEDLMPSDDLARAFSKLFRRKKMDDDFDDIYKSGEPIVDQMESYAKANGDDLELGWKVDLAKEFQNGFNRSIDRLSDDIANSWILFFNKLTNQEEVS